MSDLRELEERITSNKSDALAERITGMVNLWAKRRDVEYERPWSEFRRMWRGEWAPQDRDRHSERSKAIMPAISQAVDSAVSEVEEAMFGRERWLDLDTDDKTTPQDEGGMGRQIADNLMHDMRHMKAGVSECALLAAIYGTGIGKVVIKDAGPDQIRQELLPIQPMEFVIDPAAETIEEAHGVAHCFHLPRNVVLERQRQGIYDDIDPGSAPADKHHNDTPQYLDTDTVHILEYQGLVPARMLPTTTDDSKKLAFEDDRPVEAIVTIANDNVLLRATENPLPLKDRGFVAFQWSTVPGRFWGRGVVEMGYWPQKVLDSEIRSRIDALALSVHPMMGINAAMVPRGGDFSVRPGRNVFFNGNPAEAAQPFKFPPPDPQTYTQSQEMARYIEMGTGQLQAATPFGSNGRNETASGMSMMLGASIRRTRRTMANIERQFMRPLVAKVLERFQEFDDPQRYPLMPFPFKIHGTLGMMAREFEQVQLTQLMQAMPPGPTQLMLLRAVVDNMSLVNRQGMVGLVDQLLQQSLQPQEPPPDLGGMARMLSAQTREKEVELQTQLEAAKLRMEEQKLQFGQTNNTLAHQRDLMRISVDADRQDSEEMQKTSASILNLAKAEAEELGAQLEQYRESLNTLRAPTAENAPTQGIDVEEIRAELQALKAQLEAQPTQQLTGEDIQPIRIDRDAEGLVTGVNGRAVQRNAQGLIETLQ